MYSEFESDFDYDGTLSEPCEEINMDRVKTRLEQAHDEMMNRQHVEPKPQPPYPPPAPHDGMRWSSFHAAWLDIRPDVDAFLADIEQVCRKHGMSIGCGEQMASPCVESLDEHSIGRMKDWEIIAKRDRVAISKDEKE